MDSSTTDLGTEARIGGTRRRERGHAIQVTMSPNSIRPSPDKPKPDKLIPKQPCPIVTPRTSRTNSARVGPGTSAESYNVTNYPPPSRRAMLGAIPLLPFVLQRAAVAQATPALVPFLERVGLQPGELYGDGLEGRLSYDLRRILQEGPITGNADFYIRTRAPEAVRQRQSLDDWLVQIIPGDDSSGHQVDFSNDGALTIQTLRERSRPMGAHLLECSGNTSRTKFGLLSVAEWDGVPVQDLFDEFLWNIHSSTLVEVIGNDEHSAPSRSSKMGASWVFPAGALREAGAFLATKMNGEALPLDHGAPVRLIVPNWYGCSCIKWVETIRVVPFNYPATGQMQEFASRTHQDGRPELAADYIPATLDFTAMPLSVEGPDASGVFVVHGLAWGDPNGVETLQVSYSPRDLPVERRAWQLIEGFEPQHASSWTTWSHRLVPEAPGELEIRLRCGEAGLGRVRTRRLDSGFYARRIRV